MGSGVERVLHRDSDDGRLASLPAPAVNLASRVAQLVRQKKDGVLEVRLLVIDGSWYLLVDGETERLGKW